MKNENEVKFLIQKAEMALLAGRYHEAQETYEDCLKFSSEAMFWVGLAKTKILRLPEGQKMFEVIACIQNAKEAVGKEYPMKAAKIDGELISTTIELLSSFKSTAVYQIKKIHEEEVKKENADALAAGIGVIGALSGLGDMSKGKPSKTTLAAAGVAGSVGLYALNKRKQIANSKEALAATRNFFEEIKSSLHEYYSKQKQNEEITNFLIKITQFAAEIESAHPLERTRYIRSKLTEIYELIDSEKIDFVPYFEKSKKKRKLENEKFEKEKNALEELQTTLDESKAIKDEIKSRIKEKANTFNEISKGKIDLIFKQLILDKDSNFTQDIDITLELDNLIKEEKKLEIQIAEIGEGFMNKAKAITLHAKLKVQEVKTKSMAKKIAKDIVISQQENCLAYEANNQVCLENFNQEERDFKAKFESFIEDKIDRLKVFSTDYDFEIDEDSAKNDERLTNTLTESINFLKKLRDEKKKLLKSTKEKIDNWIRDDLGKLLKEKEINPTNLGPLRDLYFSLPIDAEYDEYAPILRNLG